MYWNVMIPLKFDAQILLRCQINFKSNLENLTINLMVIGIPIAKIKCQRDHLIFIMQMPISTGKASSLCSIGHIHMTPRLGFDIEMTTFQYGNFYCRDKTVVRFVYWKQWFPVLIWPHLYIESGAVLSYTNCIIFKTYVLWSYWQNL